MRDLVFDLQRFASLNNTTNNTLVSGTYYADTITNSGDSVTIFSGNGNDSVHNGIVKPRINGYTVHFANNVTINTGDGDDTIENYGTKVSMDGGAGDDSIISYANSDSVTIDGGEGNDFVYNYGANALIDGGAGNDSLGNSGASVSIDGGAGQNHIVNLGSHVTINTGNDADFIHSDGGTSVIIMAGDGNDSITNVATTIWNATKNAIETIPSDFTSIDGGAGNDSIHNELGANVKINAGTGDDTVYNNCGDSVIINTSDGDDFIHNSRGSNVTINAGTGDDTVYNSYGKNVTINTSEGNDSINNYGGANVSIGSGDGNDTITNSGKNVTIDAGAGNDSIDNMGGSNMTIVGGDGNDYIGNHGGGTTGGTMVIINGGAGDDTISNVLANFVTIEGGTGNDSITNSGGESVTINGGDGDDLISIIYSGDNSMLDGGAGNDSITNQGSSVTINGGYGNDTISTYFNSKITVDGGDGNDIIYSESADSSIFGGAGNDSLVNSGAYLLKGTVMTFYSGTNSTLDGGAGDDYIQNYGIGTVKAFGGAGDDAVVNSGRNVTINGGTGNDSISLTSNAKNNLIEYAVGDDNDTVWGFNDDDTLQIGGGKGTYSAQTVGNDILVTIGEGSVLLKNAASLASVNISGTDKTSADTTPADTTPADNPLLKTLTDGNDTYTNSLTSATILALGGNDTINNSSLYSSVKIDGGDGDNVILNGMTNDLAGMMQYMRGGDSATIVAGTGNDTIQNTGMRVLIDGGDGDNLISNAGHYEGGGSDVTIKGGNGNDSIYNYDCGDNVLINGGAGNDKFDNFGSNVIMDGGEGNDIIGNSGSIVTIDGGSGNDTIENWGSNVVISAGSGNDKISSKYLSNVTINGGEGNDSIFSTCNFVTIDGDEGNDFIRNRGTDAIINGGDGDDTIDNAPDPGYYYGSSASIHGTNVSISGGNGDDSIRNGARENVTIDTGEGNDTIKVGNTSVTSFAVTNFGAGDVIELYRKVDSIKIVGGSIVAGDLTIAVTAGESNTWEIDGTSATFTRTKSAGGAKLSADGKVITFVAGTGSGTSEELFVISGLKSGVTAAELSANIIVEGSTVTVGKNILGDDDVEISEGYTLALAEDVPTSDDIAANWSVSGTTATYTGEYVTEGYALKGNKIVYRNDTKPETFTLTGVKKNLTKSILKANVTIDGATVTLNKNVLGESNVSISDDWTLELAPDVPQSAIVLPKWNISSNGETATAIYTSGGSTSGYALVDNKIIYANASGGSFTLTGLSKDFTADDVSIEDKKIILSADALAQTTVTLKTEDGFTLALSDDCPKSITMDKSWTLSGTTAVLHDTGKSEGYKLATSKSVTYSAATGGKNLLTVKGLTDGLSVVNGEINGLSVNGKVLTVTPDVVGENFSVGKGYKVVFAAGNYGGSQFTGTTGKDTIEVNGSGLSIDGGAGNDTITSKNGGNIYLFSSASAKDIVIGYGDDDTIKITDDSEVTATVKNNDVIIKAGSSTMTLKNAATGTQVTVVDSDDNTLIDEIFYADRIIKDNSATLTPAFKNTTFATDETVTAVDGSATSVKFSLTGGNENNTLIGGNGANFINGGGGENILTGGKGNDTFAAGNGVDTITDYGNGTDKISLTADIASFSVEDDDVILNFDDEKSLTISDGVDKKITFLKNGRPSTEIFTTDGKTNTAATSITLAASTENYTESAKRQTIDGGLTDDVFITGGDKTKQILGGKGDDTLAGGKANTTLTGGDGSDIFVYETGKYVITDYVSGEDKISLGAAPTSETITKDNVILKFGTNSLTINKVGEQAITFVGEDGETTKTYFSEKIIGNDGVTLQSTFRDTTFAATEDLPEVDATATTRKLTLTGGDEDNTLIGGRGANLINGNAGNDLLIGNGGADTFVYSSGNDTIADYGNGSDKISLTSSMKDFDLSGDDVIIAFDDGSLTIADAAGKSVSFLETTTGGKITTKVNVFAEDGIFNTAKTAATIKADTSTFDATDYAKLVTIDGGLASDVSIVGNKNKNLIYAGDGGSTINGGKGNDSLWGGSGSDTFIYENGGGTDVIYNFGNEDALQFSGDFTTSVKDNSIAFKIGSQTDAVILKDYSATNFNINGQSYTVDTLAKK